MTKINITLENQNELNEILNEVSKKAKKVGVDSISETMLSTLEIENEDSERVIDLEIKKVFNKSNLYFIKYIPCL